MYQIMGHVQVRVAIWLDPFKDAQNLGFQIVQALYSLADGGLLGVGIGKGLCGDTIPVVASDMIFAAIGEEMGLLGGAAVLLLFMLFAVRGLTTAARAKSDLAAFSAAGLTAAISFQAFTIVGGVTKLIPLTGVTLPFMSQGGSSLLASFVIVALLLRAGDEATGRSTEIANTSTELTPVGYRPGGSRGSHMRRPALDTPESGLLGRVALANRLTRTVFLFTALFAVLIGNLTYIQVFKAAEYQDMPSNNHTITKARYIKRGSIITADGLTLAESIQQEDGTYVRSYPNGNLAGTPWATTRSSTAAPASSPRRIRRSPAPRITRGWQNAPNSLAGITEPGNSVQLTIDSRIQQAAEQALAGRKGRHRGARPRTGAVLAWASAPAYDNTDIAAAMEAANASGGADTSMFDRATQALYSPGSTFKTVTLSSALENGVAALSSTYSSPGRMEIGGADVVSVNEQGHGTITLDRAFAVSSNTVFGQVAEQLGADRLVATAQAFGYGQNLGIDFSTAASIMPDPADMSTWELAWAGAGQPVGQGHTPGPQTTVMQNAVIAAAIANNGIAMNPLRRGPDPGTGRNGRQDHARALARPGRQQRNRRAGQGGHARRRPKRQRLGRGHRGRQGGRQDRHRRDQQRHPQLDLYRVCTIRHPYPRGFAGS